MKSTSRWRFLLFIALGFCLYQLRDEAIVKWIPLPKDLSPAIGKALEVQGDVRLRLHNDLLWLPLAANSPVRDGSLIFSGAESKAKIQLDNDTVLTLQANSMVQLHRIDRENFVKIAEGGVDAESKSEESLGIDSQSMDAPLKFKLSENPEKFEANSQKGREDLNAMLSFRENSAGNIMPPKPKNPPPLANSNNEVPQGSPPPSSGWQFEDGEVVEPEKPINRNDNVEYLIGFYLITVAIALLLDYQIDRHSTSI